MQNTLALFQDRKDEINLYFDMMNSLSINTQLAHSINTKLFKIMKSNLLLMLYNLVEACIRSGFDEIYESVNNENLDYDSLISELQHFWLTNKIQNIYSSRTASKKKYIETAQKIIEESRLGKSIRFPDGKELHKLLNFEGNLGSELISKICDRHGIRYTIQNRDSTDNVTKVKNERNRLAHGDISFADCARDLTLSDIKDIKDGTFQFIEDILNGMEDYCINKSYKAVKNSS